MTVADPTLPGADRRAAVLADADLRHRNPAAAQMVATTTVEQADDLHRTPQPRTLTSYTRRDVRNTIANVRGW